MHARMNAAMLAVVGMLGAAGSALAIDAEHKARADALAAKATAWLKTQQDATSGGWCVPEAKEGEEARPHFPALTGLVVTALSLDPDAKPTDAEILQGAKYLLNWQQDDGGIYDRVLPSYNTAVAVSALSKVDLPQARDAVSRGVEFLKQLQWSEESPGVGGEEASSAVTRDHVFYGGVGYGSHGRPDNSNLNMFMQALEDAGVSPADDAVQRALVFLKRTQMLDSVNDMDYADGSRQGGFVYATVENAQSVDGRAGQSHAGTVEESLDDGTRVSRLRSYGSMTYAGFKSLIYADLPRDDERVRAALGWISRHYTMDENPGMGASGQYYYLVTLARALDAWGPAQIEVVTAPGGDDYDSPGKSEMRDWENDLVDRLASLQNADGSFRSVDPRWMEDNAVLITAYAVIALRHASN